MSEITYSRWAENMREIFRSETISQFLLYGNVNDFVLYKNTDRKISTSLHTYLCNVLLAPYEVILSYDRSRGIRIIKGQAQFSRFLGVLDKYNGTQLSAAVPANSSVPDKIPQMPKTPLAAMELIDRYVQAVAQQKNALQPVGIGSSVAILLDYAQFLVPNADNFQLSGDLGAMLIKILRWGQEPETLGANILSCLIAESLGELHPMISESEFNAKIEITLPDQNEVKEYLEFLFTEEPGLRNLSTLTESLLSSKLLGLSRIHIKNMFMRALRNNQPLTSEYLSKLRKESIEKEAGGRLVFLESNLTMDTVSGHKEAKEWLRQDAKLLALGETSALPMGYLLAGRIGTGKTFLVQCFAGECGVPFVELKNFRDKWIGSTEGNLEKVFQILRALGQVVVFVDEADQATGKRNSGDGDSGLSGRIYAMLAKEMSDTKNRGKILWIFATSRPDLVEVDLKRTGRLDVHIPLFPPETESDKKELFQAMAKKLKLNIKQEELPSLANTETMGGNEMEALLVRANRSWLLRRENEPTLTMAKVVTEIVAEFRPSAHKLKLELMDLLAVKECTDTRFLPSKYSKLSIEEINRRLSEISTELI